MKTRVVEDSRICVVLDQKKDQVFGKKELVC